MSGLRTEDTVEEYNRDGPQAGPPSWTGIISSMVAGFLIGGSSCLGAAYLLATVSGGTFAALGWLMLLIAPLAALFGGGIGIWLAWKSLKRPQF
jgi:hypothetical protein